MKKVTILMYGILAYGAFFASFLYLIGFSGGILVPKHVDNGIESSMMMALSINLCLILAFGLQHSIMARPAFKKMITRMIPKSAERSTYVLATSVVLVALYVYWRPISGNLWTTESTTMKGIILGIFAFGWMVVLYSTFLINHFDLFGLRQVYLQMRAKEYTHLPMKITSLYRIVRHPLMLGFLVTMWAVPTMSYGHLLFSVGMSAYILVGIYFEERTLIKEIGPSYESYRKQVPALIPRPQMPIPAVVSKEIPVITG